MASNKRKPATKRPNAGKKSAGRTKKDYELYQDIKIVLTVFVSLFLFICNFNVLGKAGEAISGFFFGLFGALNYLFPLLTGFFIILNELYPSNGNIKKKTVFSFILFLQLDMAIDLISGIGKTVEKYSIEEFYSFYKNEKIGGGLISASVNYGLVKWIGVFGAVLCIVGLSIVSIIILTEKSIIRSVKNTSLMVKNRTNEDKIFKEELYEDRKREQIERREEKKRLLIEEKNSRHEDRKIKEEDLRRKKEERLEMKGDEEVLRKNKKAVGVTLNTTLVKEPSTAVVKRDSGDDIHEITLNNFEPSTLTYTKTDEISEMSEVKEPTPFMQKTQGINESSALSTPVLGKAKPAYEEPVLQQPTVQEEVKNEIDSNISGEYEYKFPPLSLLTKGIKKTGDSTSYIKQTALKLEQTLATFGVKATVTDYSQGPSVTRFELQPDIGVKVSRIKNLSDDIKLSLAASEIRIEAPIPGKAAIGIEVPNQESQAVMLRDLLDTSEYQNFESKLAFAVGKDIAGKPVIYGIDNFPHLLIAGATGSGKSVCINTLIMSIIYKANPDDVKMIMIDPKVVELSVYNGIPHLLLPVVTDIKKAAATLNYAVSEMNERYKKFADVGVRDMNGYNRFVSEHGEDSFIKKLPNIIIIVDEMAELMMQERKSVEDSICSLAQLARAAGIYLIIATQRPSVDVITGLIKANMPSRLAFAVTSQIDSRTILDMGGAEELLGKGDMLFFPKGLKKPVRLQGGFVSDKEVSAVVDFLKKQGSPLYDADIEEKIKSCEKKSEANAGFEGSDGDGSHDPLFTDCGFFIIEQNKATSGSLQRKFKIGFNRAARIIDELSDAGVVGPDEGTKPRAVLMSREQFENYLEEYGG